MKCGMELGRPLAVHFSQVSCTIPDNNPEFLVPSERDMHMKAFNSQYIKLVLTTRAIYITYYRKCAEVLSSKGASTSTRRNLYQDPRDLEACAEFLSSKAIYFKTWLSQVPDSLKTPRQAPGEPFSTDQSPLVFSDNHSDRPWLPLQRLVLEILYHNHCMHLYRPFINFTSTSKPPSPQNPHPPIPTPHTSRHATACATHAIAMTHILHQVQTQNNVLNGWYQVYQWQWNAALSLVGSIIANPGAPTTEAARRALDVAMRVFGHLSPACAAAVEAGRVTGELVGIVDGVVARWEGLRGREQEQEQRCGLQQQQQQQGTASSGHGTVDPVLLQEEFSATPFDFNAEQFNDAFQFPVDSSLNMNVFFDEFGGVGSEPTGGWGFPDFLNFGGLEGFGSGDGSPEQHGDSGGQGSRS